MKHTTITRVTVTETITTDLEDLAPPTPGVVVPPLAPAAPAPTPAAQIDHLIHREYNRPGRKAVYQLDSEGLITMRYASINEAAAITGVDRGSIRLAANGKLQTAGGYRWSWAYPVHPLI
jgi:hypothetical protein